MISLWCLRGRELLFALLAPPCAAPFATTAPVLRLKTTYSPGQAFASSFTRSRASRMSVAVAILTRPILVTIRPMQNLLTLIAIPVKAHLLSGWADEVFHAFFRLFFRDCTFRPEGAWASLADPRGSLKTMMTGLSVSPGKTNSRLPLSPISLRNSPN